MKLIDLIVTLLHLLVVTEAVPVNTDEGCATRPCHKQEVERRGATKCDASSKYTMEWFIENATQRPEPMSCLFYTRGLSRAARRYAKSRPTDEGPPLTTIWDVWPKAYYSKRITTTNPLRCIMQDKQKQIQYYSSMSEAFASMCHVFATVMDKSIGHDAATANDVKQDGLWFRAEFPTLQRLRQVDMIEAISEDGGRRITYWTSLGVLGTSAQQQDVIDRLDKRAEELGLDWDEFTADDLLVEDWDADTKNLAM
ncbi:hypothetical protein G6011_02547 [Alternaria panax]|uniref:Uncharacterized protein n=1 Tax=Alternaria panax TaxID=48097 RepID=A0AAD4FAE6_9PLEO|nr:hypothetical protein G6011_02547 [Alternaria panax]